MTAPRRLSSFAAGTDVIVRDATRRKRRIAAFNARDDGIASTHCLALLAVREYE